VIFLQMPNGTFQADGETLAYSHYLPKGEPREIALSLHGAGPPDATGSAISPSIS